MNTFRNESKCNCVVRNLLLLLLLFIVFLQDVVPEWQTAASNLLSTLGLKYAKEVMQELLTKFQTGQLPHFFIVSTLGQLATSNGEFVVHHT